MIDLGSWASEQHRIPSEELDDESDSEDPERD
jgi:endogenous inhibitor of DNA gyrase (YacG/DUF329 family)